MFAAPVRSLARARLAEPAAISTLIRYLSSRVRGSHGARNTCMFRPPSAAAKTPGLLLRNMQHAGTPLRPMVRRARSLTPHSSSPWMGQRKGVWLGSRTLHVSAISRRGRTHNTQDTTQSLFVDDQRKTLQAVCVDRAGEKSETRWEKHQLASEEKLMLRDLRVVDASFRSMPAVLVRPSAVIVNLEVVKAIVTHDKLLLFEPMSAHVDLVPYFSQRLGEVSSKELNTFPFEFIALEHVLIAACDILEKRLHDFQVTAGPLLDSLATTADEGPIFARLLPLKHGLGSFEIQCQEIRQGLEDVLDTDEDMAGMYLSEQHRTGEPRPVDLHEEAEMLLETYVQKVQEIENEIRNVSQNIAATEQLVHMHLDSTRNKIIKVNLMLSLGTLGLTSGAVVASVFGMNLTSSLEAHPHAFWITTAGIVGMTALLCASGVRMCARQSIYFSKPPKAHKIHGYGRMNEWAREKKKSRFIDHRE